MRVGVARAAHERDRGEDRPRRRARPTISSAPRPFWTVIIVAPPKWPARRAASSARSVPLQQTSTRSGSGSAAGSVDGGDAATAGRSGRRRAGPPRSARGRAPRGGRAPTRRRPGRDGRRTGCRSRRRRRRRPFVTRSRCTSATNSSSVTSPRLAVPSLLHAVQQVRVLVLGHVEPELLRLDPDRVDAALLAEHDRAARCATSSDEYGSIDGGSWNWLATAPLSRR